LGLNQVEQLALSPKAEPKAVVEPTVLLAVASNSKPWDIFSKLRIEIWWLDR
jgi:hypothetical protein